MSAPTSRGIGQWLSCALGVKAGEGRAAGSSGGASGSGAIRPIGSDDGQLRAGPAGRAVHLGLTSRTRRAPQRRRSLVARDQLRRPPSHGPPSPLCEFRIGFFCHPPPPGVFGH